MSSRRALVTLLVVLVASSLVRADEPREKAQARALLIEGNARYAAGDFTTALDRFRRAFEVFPSAKLLVNVAACERKLGHNERAANALEEYLRRYAQLAAPAEEDNKLAQLARTELDEGRPLLGRIATTRPPPDATLEIDGEAGPLARWVVPGTHHVVLRAPRRDTLDKNVDVVRGDTATVDLPEPAAAPRVEPIVAAAVMQPVLPPPRRRRWVLPVAIAGGVVVVGLCLGLGLGLGLQHASALHATNGETTFSP